MESLARWVHRRLLEHYGRPHWPENYEPIEELVGTILSQHTSDVNSDRAYTALRHTFASWEEVRNAPTHELVSAIRAGGLAVVKAERIQAVLRVLTNDAGRVQLPDLRRIQRDRALRLLTDLPGVGRKTAACVLLFGAHVPALPVDTHVHRVSLRLGLVSPRTSPEATSDALEAALDPRQYYAFHVNLIRLGREICKAPRPHCEICPLQARCASSGAVALRTSRGGSRYTASRSSASRATPASNRA
jgi:endonuclease III